MQAEGNLINFDKTNKRCFSQNKEIQMMVFAKEKVLQKMTQTKDNVLKCKR